MRFTRRKSRSRLAEVERKKTSRVIFLSLIIIFAIGFIAVKFGLELLVKMAIFLSPKNQPVAQEQKRLLPAAVINSTPTATNSAQIKISGYASSMANVALTVNGVQDNSAVADTDGYFKTGIQLDKAKILYRLNTPIRQETIAVTPNQSPLPEMTKPRH